MAFVVWRRNDGYVGATTSMPANYQTGGAEPTDPRSSVRPGGGEPVIFTKLDEFAAWEPARALIVQLRKGTQWEGME